MPQYQGVWTLEQQAQAQSNQQWVTDPNFKNTTLLLQADGTGSGSQNQTFLDGSTNNFFITRNGNTTQGSFSPFSQAPGYWGNYFNPSNSDELRVADNAALRLGSSDFTIECWFYMTGNSQTDGGSWVRGTLLSKVQDNNNYWNMFLNSGVGVNTGANGATFSVGVGGSFQEVSSSAPISQNAWHHIAVVRNGSGSNNLKIYIDGVSVATGTLSSNDANTGGLGVAYWNYSDAAYRFHFNGYISNARVIKGTALYTANFTPQTSPLTAVTNTSLLTCQSNRFVDNSANAFAITTNGTPSVQAFGPFAPALQWTPDVVGGSGYFDGTSDYLTLASNANLTPASSTYTFECWVYRTASGAMTIWDTSVTNGFYIHINGSNKVVLRSYGTADIITSSANAPVNAWFSVIVARGAANSTKMWINGSSSDGGSATDSTTYVAGTTYIGIYDASTVPLTGYIAGMRLVKGSDVYGVSNSTITVPTTPPTAITNTQFLLNYTNAGIYDGKMANNLETVGNAQVATSPVKYGSGSMYFDGTGDYLKIPTNPNFEIGSGDYTVECWVFGNSFSTTNGGSGIFAKGAPSSLSTDVYVLTCNGGTLNYYAFASANTYVNPTAIGPFNLQTGVWSHVAVSKANGITRVFINGISGTPSSLTYTVAVGGQFVVATQSYDPGASDRSLNGFIDDLRVTKGIGRYIANFTPPQQALPRQ
jgi:hypothetical protein